MPYDLTDDQTLLVDTARRFSDDLLAPNAAAWDEDHHFPVDVLKQLAELGFAAIYTREEHGGSGLSRKDAALIFEALSAGCVSTAAYLSIHNMVTWMVDSFGTPDQRAKWVPGLAAMERLGSYCLTEPGAGSDAASLSTKAVRDGDDFILNGTKAFISGGGGATEFFVIMARTGEAGPKGVSAFVVEGGTPGLSFGAQEKKMGWNSQPTAQVILEDCRVPADNLLGGQEGLGFKFAMAGLDGGRINIAACSLGGAQAALDAALAYTADRKQFGKPLSAFQATQFTLADMATDLDASRLMVYRAAESLDAGHPEKTKHAAMAKRFATDACFQIVDKALQLHGGYGYLKDYPVERILRDLRVHRILEGANEIMRVIIAREMVGR